MNSPFHGFLRHLRLWPLLGCVIVIALTGAGCSTGATKSGFLSDSQPMHTGKFVENYWSSAGLTKQKVSRIYLEPIDTSRIKDQPGMTVDEASKFLKTTAVYNIHAVTVWGVVEKPAAAASKLTLAITYMTPGSVSGRMWAAELGAGHAYVQLEGKLNDAATGEPLACFSDRRRDSGSIGFEDLGGDAGNRMIRRMLEAISRDFVKELSASAK